MRKRGRPIEKPMPEPIPGTPGEREITLPPRDYQPTKAESEKEYDMPDADIVTVRNAFFRRIRVKEEKPKTK